MPEPGPPLAGPTGMDRSDGTAALLGRASELQAVNNVVETAMHGQARAVLIEGEPGVGKSTLLRALLTRSDLLVLRTCCSAGDRHRPYGGLTDALRGHFGADAGTSPGSLVHDSLVRLCQAEPVMLAIDDAHWADDRSLSALGDVWSRVSATSLVVLVTSRSHEVPLRLQVLLSELGSLGALTQLRLEPLPPDDARTLATRTAGVPLNPRLSHELSAVGGNPLQLVDFVRHWMDPPGRRVPATAMSESAAEAPSLATASGPALPELSTDAWSILNVAALLDAEFSARELTEILRRPMTELLPVLRDVIGSGLVGDVDTGLLGFREGAVRSTLEARLPINVRSELHREIASALERLGAPDSKVAEHLLSGNVQPADLDWVRALAERLLSADPGRAAALWNRLSTAMPAADPRRAEVDAGLAHAQLARGDVRAAEMTARRGLILGAPPGPNGALRLTLSLALMGQRRWVAARSAAECAAARSPTAVETSEQIAIAATAALLDGDPAGAREAIERAERRVDQGPTLVSSARALAVRGHLAHVEASLSEAESSLREACGLIAGHVSPLPMSASMRVWHALVLVDLDRVVEAHSILHRLEDGLGPVSPPGDLVEASTAVAWLQYAQGSLASAARIYDSIDEELGPGQALPPPHRARHLLALLHLKGPAAIPPGAAQGHLALADPAHRHGDAWQHRAAAALHAADNDLDGEYRALETGWSATVASGLSIDLLTLGPHLAATAAMLGDLERASEVAGTLTRIADLNGGVVSMRAAALAAQAFATADADLGLAAMQLWQRSPLKLEAAQVGERVANLLCGLGKRPMGAMLAAESVRGFVEAGAMYDARRVRRAYAEGGLPTAPRPARRPATGWGALTPAERLVASIVEQGESNAEIARRLGLSRRTVESHVSHILGKLELRSRGQLIAAAAQRPDGAPPGQPQQSVHPAG